MTSAFRFRGRRPALMLTLAATPLAGCTTLPTSGPTARAIVRDEHRFNQFDLVNVDEQVVAGLLTSPSSGRGRMAGLARAGDVDTIGPGDVLQITIFEVGTPLFGGGRIQSMDGTTPGSGEALPPVTVARDGSISIPWVGRMEARDKTPDQLAAEITRAYRRNSENPQAMVSIRENLNNTVILQGDVKKPGRVPLTLARERLLDAIAIAGGPANPTIDSMVRVARGESAAEQPLSAIDAGSPDDIELLPHDRVSIAFRPRTFTVLGATGKASDIPFEALRVSLAQAIGRAGGVSDAQADPSAVFVFRYEPAQFDGSPAEGARPVAYRVNMRQAQGFFLAQRFEMRPRDVVYIANSEASIPTKAIQILNLFFSPFYTVRTLTQ